MANENNQFPSSAPSNEVQFAVANALEAEKKKKKKKKWIILAVVIVVIIAIGALASGGDDDSGKKVESINSTTVAADSADQAAPDEDSAENAAPVKVEAGNAVTTDKLKISYVSCNADYKKYNEYSAPENGNKVVRAEFKFENTSQSDVSLSGFECYADDKKCEIFYGADDYASPTLESVSPGRSFKAVVYFEVPEKADNIELEFEDDLWGNEKTIFVVK